jgi:hypothetical protein
MVLEAGSGALDEICQLLFPSDSSRAKMCRKRCENEAVILGAVRGLRADEIHNFLRGGSGEENCGDAGFF